MKPKHPNQRVGLSIRATEQEYQDLVKLANADQRTMSAMALILIREALAARKHGKR